MRFAIALLVATSLISWPAYGRSEAAPAGLQATIREIAVGDLPLEARETLARIRNGGPFPYERDGMVFGNREKLLPVKARGYYREYTVPTPGARDRGARRIVAGGCGEGARSAAARTTRVESGRDVVPCAGAEYYYTADHYRSFRRIRE